MSSCCVCAADELNADALQNIPIETLRQAWQRVGSWGPVVAPPVFPNGISPIEGVRKGLAGDVAVMSGTNRDENNLFMARMTNTPSREELEQRVAQILSGEDSSMPTMAPEWALLMQLDVAA